MELQRASVGDIDTIREMAHRIWRAHYPDIIGTEQVEYMLRLLYSEETLHRHITHDGQTFWLVRSDEGAVAGFLAIGREADGAYFLHKFYIDNEQRGRGLGARVFERLLAEYPDLRELRLTVNRRNYKSINFYFKLGFVIEQCVEIPIGRGFVMDDFRMLWRKERRPAGEGV